MFGTRNDQSGFFFVRRGLWLFLHGNAMGTDRIGWMGKGFQVASAAPAICASYMCRKLLDQHGNYCKNK